MKLRWISIIALILTGCSSTGLLISPHLVYIEPTPAESKQLAGGARYHDKKQYEQAAGQYQSILVKNPNNTVALYELALTYHVLQDYTKSLNYASRAAEYDSPFLANVYLLLGLNHEKLGQNGQAVSVYQFATDRYKAHVDLHYRLARAWLAQNQADRAAEIFKKVISLDPYHTESHLQLGVAYYEHDYKTPAFLSLMTFLLLEPDSKRSAVVVGMIDDIFKSGVVIDTKTKEISLAVNPEPKTDEGDFSLLDIVMSARRIDMLTSEQTSNEIQIKLEQLKSYLLVLSQIKTNKVDQYFITQHYAPFYKSLYKNNLVAALFYYTHQSLNKEEINNRVTGNQKQTDKVKKLFRDFSWRKH